MNILIAEDNPLISDLMAELLNKESFSVDTCANGKEGLGLVRQKDYDLIISELDMPISNGIQFLKGLRVDKKEVPFYIFSAHVSEEKRVILESLGVTKIFQKVELDNLMASVHEVHK